VGNEVVATWTPEEHHQAFPGMVNGGILGALLDCHSNWCAAHALMVARGEESPPCTVTADFHVKLRRPTPLGPLRLKAHTVSIEGDKVVVEATLEAGGKITATCLGTFVAVKEGHPAFHRW
jgi:acyl-coenzyme A thioesterase PaaI-like protein